MSKAVLVMDMPDSCHRCPCSNVIDGKAYICEKEMRVTREAEENSKPRWCPLKPMPKRHPVEKEHPSGRITINDVLGATKEGFFEGYNYCIDCLEGKE